MKTTSGNQADNREENKFSSLLVNTRYLNTFSSFFVFQKREIILISNQCNRWHDTIQLNSNSITWIEY